MSVNMSIIYECIYVTYYSSKQESPKPPLNIDLRVACYNTFVGF